MIHYMQDKMLKMLRGGEKGKREGALTLIVKNVHKATSVTVAFRNKEPVAKKLHLSHGADLAYKSDRVTAYKSDRATGSWATPTY